MNKIKKYLCAITAVLMLATNIPYISASAAVNVVAVQYIEKYKEDFKFSYNFYKTIGVVTGEYNIDSTISRGSWADILIHYLGQERAVDAYKEKKIFADHNEKYEKMGSVNLAYELGLMSEYDDGNFGIDVDVSYEDVCASVVKGLGYDMVVENKGGGYEEYIATAYELGILKNVTGTKGYPILASEVFELLDNALEIGMLTKELSDKEGVYKQGETLLSTVHNLRAEKGIVTATQLSSLYSSNKTKAGQIEIDDVRYSYDGYTDDLLGYKVRYFVSTEDDEKVVYLGKYKNDIEKIDFENVTRYENRTYFYQTDKKLTLDKQEIPSGCAVIYNGVAMSNGFAENLPNRPEFSMLAEEGSLTFVDNNTDGTYDVLLIEAYTNFFIGYIDLVNETLYDFYDETKYIRFEDYDLVELFDSYGAETTLKKIAVKNVLSVAETPDNSVIKINVYDGSIEGKVSRKDINDKTVLTIGGTEYVVSDVCSVSTVSVGFSGVFYLNGKNQIVGFDETIDATVGYLIKVGMDYEADRVTLKLLSSSGVVKKFVCAEKVKVVGGKTGRYKSEELHTLLVNRTQEVIMYELNDDSEVYSLDLIGLPNNNGSRIRKGTSFSKLKFYRSSGCFTDFSSGKILLNSGAIIFLVPKDDPADENPENYSVQYQSDLVEDTLEYSGDIYQVNDSKLGYDIVVMDSELRNKKDRGIVGSIVTSIDEDDEVIHKIEVYTKEKAYTYIAYEDANIASKNIEVGDVIAFSYKIISGNRVLSDASVIYNIGQNEYFPEVDKEARAGKRHFMGTVEEKDNKLMSVAVQGGTTETHILGGHIYVFTRDAGKAEVIKGNANSVSSREESGSTCSTIWVWANKEAPQMIYVVNK